MRPAKCPCCGAAGRQPGAPLGLVGHGTRERTLLGPLSTTGAPEQLTLRLRRYQCRSCGAVITSAPRAVLRGMLYGALAIALALALWISLPGWRVRQRVGIPGDADYARLHGWRSLGRWARSAARYWPALRLDGGGRARDRARAVVTQLAARAPAAAGPLVELGCAGALRA